MRFPRNWFSIAVVAAALYATATVAGAAVMLLLTFSIETIGFGLLVPLFALPALLYFVVATASDAPAFVRHTGFWLLFLPFPLLLLYVAFFPSPGARSDGADEWAFVTAVPLIAAGIVSYVVDQIWHLTRCCN